MSRPEDNRDRPDAADGSPDELLGDLESIKELLDEEAAEKAGEDQPAESDADARVPLLDDMVDGAYELEEPSTLLSATPALGSGSRNTPASRRGRYLSEDVFEALLGDKWKSSASDILTEARGAIEAHRNQWAPEDTDELNQALRVRIDETLTEWLKATIAARLDELHAELLRAAESVIDEKIQGLKATPPNPAGREED